MSRDTIDLPADTLRHKVGECPGCRDYLWADVDVIARVGEPLLSIDGRPTVHASAKVAAVRLAPHHCTRQDDDLWAVATWQRDDVDDVPRWAGQA